MRLNLVTKMLEIHLYTDKTKKILNKKRGHKWLII